ncbi:MAG: hypothetical protein U9R47_07360, partial [Actinomycetota bacterium]|nr:hypothetical protein [Actinomycetota bacterium]
RRWMLGTIAVVLLASACGGGDSLSSDETAWCLENFDIVGDAADDLGLIDYVFAYYETEGDGLGSDGEPKQTEKNIEVSEDLRRRNAEDPGALIDDLYANYLEHPDGQKACAAAYAEEG